MKNKLLGKMSVAQFLRDYWQKKPLLIRQALPGFGGLLNKQQLISLAGEEEAQSRLVRFYRNKWTLAHGPFQPDKFAKLAGNWTLLVQDVNHFLPQAQALLQAFNFIPQARLDDLMVSFATNGAGVGPHVDSYDVFLLQGAGQRLWQISRQPDQRLLPDVPLCILQNFKPEHEWLLEPGDMLYLPPNYAHNGIAVGEAMTYSIGFRAASHQELISEFLAYLQDHLLVPGRYADPDLKASQHPACITNEMIDKVSAVLNKIRFKRSDVKGFLGQYLSEPKAHIFFDPPRTPLAERKFLKQAQHTGISLDLKTQMLFTDNTFFINGEACRCDISARALLKQLANKRQVLLPAIMHKQATELLYAWYLAGYLYV